MKADVFKVELNRIKNENVRKSTEIILELIPDYFYEIPASSSGKYHPSFALNIEHTGGLVRHVKVAERTLEEMFRNESFGTYSDYTKDLMRMAVILHDGLKSGFVKVEHTITEHPVLMSDYITSNQDKLLISDEDAEFVSMLIESHMGPWNKNHDGKSIMPKPLTKEQLLVHWSDYWASRSYLDVAFENNEIIDSADRAKTKVLTTDDNKKTRD